MKPFHVVLIAILALSAVAVLFSQQQDATLQQQEAMPSPSVDVLTDNSEETMAMEASEDADRLDDGASKRVASALEIIHERKSVRSYTDEPVSRDDLETAIRAGMAAPTGGNRQPWVYMVVSDRERLDALSEIARGGRMLAQAAAAIMVGGVPEWGVPGEANAYWVQDCSAATQNILLAIEALDLGAVWIGIHPREAREQQVREILGLPSEVVPLNLIAIGHPAGDEKPKDKFRSERIHWEEWSPEQFERR